ncbi:MAG: hypothetical protein ACJAS1_000555 [Oleiphilaceae bacterium]|jgi:hypothetical protein
MNYVFHTTCVDSYSVGERGEDIDEMVDSHHATEIDNKEFISVVADEAGIKQNILDMFEVSEKQFVNDWALSCHRSHFQGLDCLYVQHSRIEHIFVRQDLMPKIVTGIEGQQRRAAVEELDEMLDEYDPWGDAKEPEQQYIALTKFVEENKDAFSSNNILLASLFAYGNDYGDVVRRVDKELLTGL